MHRLPTIGGLLEKANARYRVFDMGRRVVKIPNSRFLTIENGDNAYPLPLQQQAWLGILFWDGSLRNQHFVWFLRFPLDELGGLQSSARDEFLDSVLQALGVAQRDVSAMNGANQESPYAFQPREARLAAFHAKALVELGLPASRYYAHARDYLAGKAGYDQWAFVGLQGLADVVVRLGEDGNAALLERAIHRLPLEPLRNLCELLENESLPGRIAWLLRQRLFDSLHDPSAMSTELTALVRAVGNTSRGDIRHTMVEAVLTSQRRTDTDLLIVIAGRAWEALRDDTLRLRYLEALVRSASAESLFPALLRDLLFVPGMRPLLLSSFRSPDRSPQLAAAIGALISGVGAGH